MSQSSHEWVVTQHWEEWENRDQSCFKNSFYPQDLWVCLLSSWNQSHHCSWLFHSFRCRRPSAQDDVLRVSAHLNLCSWQAYSKVSGVNPHEAPGGTVWRPPSPRQPPPHTHAPNMTNSSKTGTYCATSSSNAAVKKICENVLLHLLQAMCGLGAGGSSEGKRHSKNCKAKNKTTSCQKREGKKKYASGHLSLLPSPSNIWKPTLLRTSHDSSKRHYFHFTAQEQTQTGSVRYWAH